MKYHLFMNIKTDTHTMIDFFLFPRKNKTRLLFFFYNFYSSLKVSTRFID